MPKITPPCKVWQWDINDTIIVEGIEDISKWQVHFASAGDSNALVLEINPDMTCYIPNQLVELGTAIYAYLYNVREERAYTETAVLIPVNTRPKPSDYISEPTDVLTWGQLRADIGTLSQLETEDKTNLVAAVNELHGDIDSIETDMTEQGQSITAMRSDVETIKQSIADINNTDAAQSQQIAQNQQNIDALEQSDTQLAKSVSSLAQTVDKGFEQVQTELDKKQPAGDYITNAVDNLVNYYLKSETYSQSEVKDLIGSLTHINIKVVSSIDDVTEPNVIYLVPVNSGKSDDYYNEYILVNGNPELIGNTRVDLSDYYTREQTDNLLKGKQPIGSYVTSVNGNAPDEGGNVSIDVQTYTAGEGIDISESGEIAVTNPMNDEQVSDGTTWSSLNIIQKLTTPFTETGNTVTCYPVEGSPLYVVSDITAVQEGEGDPSPENIRPISGWDGANLVRSGQTYTADFGETVYGGTLDWSTGVLTVTWLCVIFTGTEEWIASGDVDNIFSRSLPMLAKVANRYNFKCSHYKTQVAKNDSFWVESTGVKARIQAEFNSTDEWMGYVTAQYNNGTPLQILYEINQPYTIQLTPAQILAISGLNTVYCDTGDVTVTGYEDPRHTVAQLTSRIAALESAATGI